MTRKTASIFSVLFLVALLVGLNMPASAASPLGSGNDLVREGDSPDQLSDEDDDGDENDAPIGTQNQNAENSATASTAATSASLGSIQVGPSASGEALRILSTGYVLRSLTDVCPDCIGVIVGPADLGTPWIIGRLKAAYEAGHAVGLTNATAGASERLRDLVGHRGRS